MTSRAQFEVLKAGARWRVGRTVECELGVTLDEEGPGVLHAIEGVASATALRARLLHGAIDEWNTRAGTLAVLGHPNVVAVVGVGVLDGNAFLIEERPEGEQLRRWAQKARAARGAISLEEVAKLAVPIAGALRHAHDANFVHGVLDASCVNVAHDSVGDFDVRVAGFGLGLSLRELREELRPETWITLAPEAIVDGAKVEPTADLFSLGVLLLEALTGSVSPLGTRPPWREIANMGAGELRKVLGEQREDVPNDVWDLIAGLLAADPKQRVPASARELMRAMQKLSWEPRIVVKHEARRARAAEVPMAARPNEPAEAARPTVAKIVSVTTRRVDPKPLAESKEPISGSHSAAALSPPIQPPENALEKKLPRPGDTTLGDGDTQTTRSPTPIGKSPQPATNASARQLPAADGDLTEPNLFGKAATPGELPPRDASSPPTDAGAATLVDDALPSTSQPVDTQPPTEANPTAEMPATDENPVARPPADSTIPASRFAQNPSPALPKFRPQGKAVPPPPPAAARTASTRPSPSTVKRESTATWGELARPADEEPPPTGHNDPTLQRVKPATPSPVALDATERLSSQSVPFPAIEPLRPGTSEADKASLDPPVPSGRVQLRPVDSTEPVIRISRPPEPVWYHRPEVIVGAFSTVLMIIFGLVYRVLTR